MAEDYAALDDHGQRVVRVVTDEELSRLAAASAPAPDIAPAEKTVPLFGTSFAAGPAEQESDLKWEPYAVPAEDALRLSRLLDAARLSARLGQEVLL